MKAGVMLSDFFSQGVAQLGLFDEHPPRPDSTALMQVIDRLNRSGRGLCGLRARGGEILGDEAGYAVALLHHALFRSADR